MSAKYVKTLAFATASLIFCSCVWSSPPLPVFFSPGAKTPGEKKTGSGGDDQTQEQKINDAVANAKGATFEERFENARRSSPDLFKPEAQE